MGRPHVVSQLSEKYALLLGELGTLKPQIEEIKSRLAQLPDLEHRAAEITSTLEHVETSIKLFDVNWTPKEVQARRPYTTRTPFKRGELLRLAMTLMRETETPMTVREIMTEIIRERGLVDLQAEELESLCGNLNTTFKNREQRGLVAHEGSPKRWSLIRKRALTAA